MQAVLDHSSQITPTIRTFWLRPERPVRYTAGQFVELYLPHHKPDERGARRWFTLSSSPTEELLGITTRLEPHKSSSFKTHLASLKPGAKLHITDPMGDFVLPKNPAIPLVFVAAGLGITPVRSMVKWLHDTGEHRNIRLIQAAPAQELAFAQLFKDYGLAYMPVAATQHQQLAARAIIEKITEAASLIYISGPEQLVETLYKDLQKFGVSPGRLVADYFPGYPS